MYKQDTENPIISIILPVFNGENTIARCIESILSQTFSCFELIIIDDGSIDQSLSICEKYKQVDLRIKLFTQSNRGVSSARNRGIDAAVGLYICFIDADDWVSPSYLSNFFKGDILDDQEIVFQDFTEEFDGKSFVKCHFSGRRYTKAEFQDSLKEQKLLNYAYPFCKLYYKNIIHDNAIRFKEDIFFIEDRIFLLEYLQCMKFFRYRGEADYHYSFDNKQQQSLTFRHNSYESEIKAYYTEKHLLNMLSKEFSFDNETLDYSCACNGLVFYRAIRAMYRPQWRKPFRERLYILRKQYTYENIVSLQTYSKVYLGEMLNRIAVYLYVSKLFYIYDAYTCFFVFIRYRISFAWKLFRRIIKPIKD